MRQLNIDPEFRDKIPPLSADEFSRLEENIVADGEIREPLVVWHNTIIDGHHRYKIVQKHPEIPFKVKQMDFPDKWAAIVWMCRNQLGRRNITDEQKTALIGEAYKAQKMTHGGNTRREHDESGKFTTSRQNGDLRSTKTKDVIAKQFGVGSSTVERAEQFVDGLNEAEKVSPGIKEAVLSGSVNDNDLYASYIRVIKQSWNGDPAGAQAQILRGLGLFMRTYKGQFKEDVLIEKLQKKHPNDIVRDAQVDRSTGARKYAVQILLTYNFSQREQNRLPNLL